MASSNRLQRTFWRDLPARSLAAFMAAVFCTFASLGFLIDISTLGRQTPAGLAYLVVMSGTVASLYGYLASRRLALMPLALLLQLAMTWAGHRWLPAADAPLPLGALRDRLVVDVAGTIVSVMLGYVLFMVLIVREGTRAVVLRAELALAREIHQSLVPPIARTLPDVEACGVSAPSGDVGGDLVDFVVEGERGWIGYVADVSGHGVSAGLVMTMVKSAARAELRRGADLPTLLATLNRTVLDAGKPNMFVTFAAVRCHTTGELEFTVAGHLPILHMPAHGGPLAEWSIPQIPLGIVDDYTFASRRAAWGPGDLLAVVTDGLSEVFDRADREFGLEGIVRLLEEHRAESVDRLRTRLLAAVRAHGAQLDDQTLLFLRRP
jgi:sigma-B regulation protein RsbU (phosphoserine phosphatase)